MTLHFMREIERLKKNLLELSALVDTTVMQAVQALHNRDLDLANAVIRTDERIDQWEVEIEEECQKVLALHQPVAHDLRYVIAVIKINNELERIGDAAVNIAERVLYLSTHDVFVIPFDFEEMAQKSQAMLKLSLDALIERNARLALKVIAADDAVDEINRHIYVKIRQMIQANPDNTEALLHLLGVARHLERIADHTTNIAEDVIYLASGEIIRHRTEQFEESAAADSPESAQ